MTGLRLAFMGSPEFAVPTFEALIDAGHDIICVYSQPPKRAGRGKKLRPTPVHAFAESRSIPVRTPKSLKSDEEKANFAALDLDAAVVVAYGLILPQAILDAPRLGCVNLHGSLLPRWRGAAPIQRAVMAGDRETGVQAMMMEAGLDTGPVLLTAKTPISLTDTAGSVHDRLAALGAELMPRALSGLAGGSLKPEPQAESGVTYASKLGPDDQRIDWSNGAREIDCQIRGLSPFPGAYCFWQPDGESESVRLKILISEVLRGTPDHPPGTVLGDDLRVACGAGVVRILKLQKPGGKPMDAEDFLRGTPIPDGAMLT